MANFNLDIIKQSLPKIVAKSSVSAPVDDFLTRVLFGKGVFMGNEGVDGIEIDYQKLVPTAAAEALRGQDATRVNFSTGFSAHYIKPAYFHMEDEVTLDDADVRAFGEDITDNPNTKERVLKKFAQKRDGMVDSIKMSTEALSASAIINGYITTKEGGQQAFPMTSSLLSLSGSALYSDFLGTIATAFKTIRKKNKGFRANALVLNATYATQLVTALNNAGLINKEGLALATVKYGEVMGNGAQICGSVNSPAGTLMIIAYYGNDGTNDYIPDGKAVLCSIDQGIGGMAYGRVQAFVEGVGKTYTVEQIRVTPGVTGKGDMRAYGVEVQSAPCPVIVNIDGYGVLTNIPANLS